MRALCARRLARSGLLPGLMRLAGGASVVLTSPPLRAAEVRITPAPLQESRPARQQDGADACHFGRLTPLARGHPGASSGSAISMKCSGSSRSAAWSRHLAASSVRMGQTAASATAAT